MATQKKAAKQEPIVCTLCSDDIEFFGVFDCAHFCCFRCALRIRRTFRKEGNAHHHHHSHNHNQPQQQQQNRRAGEPGTASSSSSAATSAAASGGGAATHGTCHVCRSAISSLVVTELAPCHPDTAQYEKAEMQLFSKVDGINVKRFHPLNCITTSDQCVKKLTQLIQIVCPFDGCWKIETRQQPRQQRSDSSGSGDGSSNIGGGGGSSLDVETVIVGRTQEPFLNFDQLQKHLRTEHAGQRYCDVCYYSGLSFLSELRVYSAQELAQHQQGCCASKDIGAFGGHPCCRFCNNKLLYDGDAMLEHLKTVHYVCDFCNINSYKFIYYNDREALNLHWAEQHKLCTHPECVNLDPVSRVFASELELTRHLQTRHGVKQTVSLDSLGFRFGADTVSVPPRRNNMSNNSAFEGNLHMGPIESAPNLKTTMITFDFVHRREVVPLLPKFANENNNNNNNSNSNSSNNAAGGGRGARGGGRAARGAQQQQQQQQQQQLATPQPNSATAAAAASSASAGDKSTAAASSTSSATAATSGVEDADSKLRRLLQQSLTPVKERDFNAWTVKFLKEQIKAIEYVQQIVALFPPVDKDEAHTFVNVCDCLAETIKQQHDEKSAASGSSGSSSKSPSVNPILRDALLAAKQMLLSSESRQQKEAAEETERQQKREEVKKAHHAALKGAKPVGQSKGGNVWQQKNLATPTATTNTLPAWQTQNNNSSGGVATKQPHGNSGKGNAWGTPSATASSTTGFIDAFWGDNNNHDGDRQDGDGNGGVSNRQLKQQQKQQIRQQQRHFDEQQQQQQQQRKTSPSTSPATSAPAWTTAVAPAATETKKADPAPHAHQPPALPTLAEAFPGSARKKLQNQPEPKLKGAWKNNTLLGDK